MTWGEFKAAVEQQGVDDTLEIFWIDVSQITSEGVVVEFHESSFSVEDV